MPPDYVTPDIWFPNLGFYFENVPRVALSIFGFNLYWYAVFIATGLTAAFFMGIWWVKKSGQKVEDYVDMMLMGIPIAIAGLRIYYMVFNWEKYAGRNLIAAFFDIRGGGLAIYGGIIGAILVAAITSMRKNIPFTTIADTGAPSMLLGQVIGRFGNFFNREAFGGYTDGLFAMRLRTDQVLSRATITAEQWENAVIIHGAEYIQAHPTFIYEAAFNLVLMVALLIYRPYKRFGGEIVLYYFLGYGVIRFFIESLRTDQMMFFNTGIPLNQLTAVLFVIVSLALIIAGHLRAREAAKNPAPAPVTRRRRTKRK